MSKIEKIFACRRCGFCCKGETTVSLDADDRSRMIECLGMAEEEVYTRYLRVTGNCVQMQTVDGHCIFYKDGCLVHTGRPWRCGQWPLHPSILEDQFNFHIIADSCPGIRADIGYEEFCRILREVMAIEDKVRC